MRRLILGWAMSIMLFGGSVFAETGRGTHVAGTIGAIGNNAIGGQGSDVLLGSLGTDHISIAVNLFVAGVQYLVVR